MEWDKKIYTILVFTCLFFMGQQGQTRPRTVQKDSIFETVIIISQTPENTPHDASLYITTNIRGWYPDVEENKFFRRENGTYEITFQHDQPQFEYKITRGSWKSVEGRANGRAIPNRLFQAVPGVKTSVVTLSVESWEDLSQGSVNLYVYLLYLAAVLAMMLIIAINTIRNKNKKANAALSVLLLLSAIAMIGRAATYDRDIFNWFPKLILAPEIILFTYAPVFYLYICLLLKIKLPRFYYLHFAPVLIQILVYLPYLTLNDQTFIYRIIDKELHPIFAVSGSMALLFSISYWLVTYRMIRQLLRNNSNSLDKRIRQYPAFLKTVLMLMAACLLLWILLSVVYLSNGLIVYDTLKFTETLIDVVWVLFSFIIVCLAYFAMKQPEIFTSEQPQVKARRYKYSTLQEDEAEKIKRKLLDLLDKEKVYLNPDLTLPELSHQIPTSVHTLSRVINEGFNQTFSQLINEKRVQEFIRQAESGEPYESFLSLAYAVGFNSKATFNRSFKKYTNSTPRNYFKREDEKKGFENF